MLILSSEISVDILSNQDTLKLHNERMLCKDSYWKEGQQGWGGKRVNEADHIVVSSICEIEFVGFFLSSPPLWSYIHEDWHRSFQIQDLNNLLEVRNCCLSVFTHSSLTCFVKKSKRNCSEKTVHAWNIFQIANRI